MSEYTLIDELLSQQRELTAVERFSTQHDLHGGPAMEKYYRDLIPGRHPGEGEQYSFEVDLDVCSGCKACVAACHSLNGLDEHESWRSVGVLHGGTRTHPYQATVTTACHHCLDPGCLRGCPVRAYEKDAVTGIVRHLDDQCIGCEYCVMTCAYEVPQYSEKRGIVRKCDMCHDRLAAGEAPACVQACPNEAITIRIIKTSAARQRALSGHFLPDAPDPLVTLPTTLYRTSQSIPADALAGNHEDVIPQPAHWPLALMLTATQVGIGLLAISLGNRWLALGGAVVFFMGLAASVSHLGQPLRAWRFFLGLRESWLSREILALGIFSGIAAACAVLPWVPIAVPPIGLWLTQAGVWVFGGLGVFCSVMVYADTRRIFWNFRRVGLLFFGTTVLAGCCAGLLIAPEKFVPLVFFTGLGILMAEYRFLTRTEEVLSLRRAGVLYFGSLNDVRILRVILMIFGAMIFPLAIFAGGEAAPLAVLAAASCLASEVLGRHLFFRACVSDRMPGGL